MLEDYPIYIIDLSTQCVTILNVAPKVREALTKIDGIIIIDLREIEECKKLFLTHLNRSGDSK